MRERIIEMITNEILSPRGSVSMSSLELSLLKELSEQLQKYAYINEDVLHQEIEQVIEMKIAAHLNLEWDCFFLQDYCSSHLYDFLCTLRNFLMKVI